MITTVSSTTGTPGSFTNFISSAFETAKHFFNPGVNYGGDQGTGFVSTSTPSTPSTPSTSTAPKAPIATNLKTSSSGGVPVANNISVAEPMSFDIAQKNFQNTLTIPTDPTLGQALLALKLQAQTRGLYSAVKSAPSELFSAITNSGKPIVNYQQEQRIKNLSSDQLKQQANLGNDQAANLFIERKANLISNDAIQTQSLLLNQDVQAVQKQQSSYYQDMVSKGKISPEDANKGYQKSVQNFIDSRTQNANDAINNQVQKALEADPEIKGIVKQNQIAHVVKNLALTVGIGIATGGVLAVVPEGIATAAEIGGGLMFASDASKTALQFADKKISVANVGLFSLQSAGFLIGAKVGSGASSRFFGGDNLELNSAINNAYMVQKSAGIIKESDLIKLDIPQFEKAQITAKLNEGYSVKKVSIEIEAKTAAEQKLIDQNLPNRKIQFVQTADRMGNIIDSTAIGKIEVSKGNKIFRQHMISRTSGIISPEGTVETQTLSLGLEKGKVKSASLTSESASGIFAENLGYKILRSNGETRLVESRKVGKAPLTYDDLIKISEAKNAREILKIQDIINKREITKEIGNRDIKRMLIEGMGEKGFKISENSYFEAQKKTGANKKSVEIRASKTMGDEVYQAASAAVFREKTSISKGKGISRNVNPINNFKRGKLKTSFSKTYDDVIKLPYLSNKKTNQFNFGKIPKKNKQIGSGFAEMNYPDYFGGSGTDIGIKKRAATKIHENFLGQSFQEEFSNAGINDQFIRDALKKGDREINARSSQNIFAIPSLNVFGKEKEKTILNFANVNVKSDTVNLQKQFEKQQQSFNQKFDAVQKFNLEQANASGFQKSNFKFPGIDTLFGFNLGNRSSGETLNARGTKSKTSAGREKGYAPSLSEAFFEGKPVKISNKGYQNLKNTSFLGSEIRPLIEIINSKPKKKK